MVTEQPAAAGGGDRPLLTPGAADAELSNTSSEPYSLWQLVAYVLRLGTLGFGGPVALVGYMHRDLVERRRWITDADYKEGLTLAQLMPGPLAAQLAIYLGYVHYGVLGASAALLWRYKRLPEPLVVLGAAIIGLLAYRFAGR
jgi:chromate transporter